MLTISLLGCLALMGTSMFTMAKIPPIEISVSPYDGITVGGDGIFFATQLPANMFSSMLVAVTNPNATTELYTGGDPPLLGHNATLNPDGTISISGPIDNSHPEWCMPGEPNPIPFGIRWSPDVPGNFTANVGIGIVYSSGPEPYTYPNSAMVCIKSPYSYEYATLATYHFTVLPQSGTSVGTGVPIPGVPSTVELPATITGVPYQSRSSSTRSRNLHIPGLFASITLLSIAIVH
ncbi:hypothetical protein FRC14_006911 [Serendipita sp. 396]|nr:hypothetical protein FRC14_006911 [Serendipita sp. 396]KAG8782628.1 hypothetical protein FRC15_006667 [Serendipita sp. 397]KAG8812862.1 hypothetical protein FRC18_002762 [Serendipita sp. 400]